MTRRSWLALVAISAVVVATTATPAGAAPAPDSGPGSGASHPRLTLRPDQIKLSDIERAQAPLVGLAYQIRQQVGRHHWSQYTGVAVDVAQHQVTLYWKGTPPAALRASVRVPAGVRLADVAVPYSRAELDAEAQRIASQNQATVASVGVRPDFAGLQVAVDRSAAAAVPASLTSSIPLTFTTRARVAPAVSRWDDVQPFWGGDVITRTEGSGYVYCSTAFGGHLSNGLNVMVTAYHCGHNVDWQTPSGWNFGHVGAGYTPIDTNIVAGGGYDDSIYTGGPDSNGGVPIYGAQNPPMNSYVLASGGFSGSFAVLVNAVDQFTNLEGVGTVGPGFYTVDTTQTASIGQGDSGGPVTQTVSLPDGTFAVLAGGVVTGLDTAQEGTCQGVQYPGRECSTHTFHTEIESVMLHWGLTIGNTTIT